MKIALIPCGATEWHEQGRLLGRADLPLSEVGRQQLEAWAVVLTPLRLSRLLHAADDLSVSSAQVLATALRAKTKVVADLVELDAGLWSGLTEPELETRYESAYQESCDAPLNVQPPGGEPIAEAQERLWTCFRRQLRAGSVHPVGFVLRPVAWRLACALLARQPVRDVLSPLADGSAPCVLEALLPLARE